MDKSFENYDLFANIFGCSLLLRCQRFYLAKVSFNCELYFLFRWDTKALCSNLLLNKLQTLNLYLSVPGKARYVNFEANIS